MTDPKNAAIVRSLRGLTLRQRRVLPVVITAGSIVEGCARAGIRDRTWRKWMESETFQDAVGELLDARSMMAAALLEGFLPEAVAGLITLARDENKQIRSQNLQYLASKALSEKKQSLMEKRLAELDKRVSKLERGGR